MSGKEDRWMMDGKSEKGESRKMNYWIKDVNIMKERRRRRRFKIKQLRKRKNGKIRRGV